MSGPRFGFFDVHMHGIRVEGLQKRFGARVAVEGLTFDVRPGEVFGLLGPNGAGKTTTVRMLTGLLEPSAGRASVCGVELPLADDGTALRRRVGLLTEQPGLYDRLSARENLDFFIQLNEVDRTEAWRLARSLLERFELAGREDEPVGGFSKGMRQKLAIVRALVHSPEVVFLDEPTSGLDPASGRVVRDAIAELAKEGRTMVLCSHNLPEVERLCSRVAVIKRTLRAVANVSALKREGAALDVTLEGPASTWLSTIERLPFTTRASVEGERLRVTLDDEARTPDVIAALVHAGARVVSAQRAARPLEEAYLELVRDDAGSWEALVGTLLAAVQFSKAPLDEVGRVLANVALADEVLRDALDQALASSTPISSVVSTPHDEAMVRRFLEAVSAASSRRAS